MIMKWSELSMKDKAAVMKVAIGNGIMDLNDIKNKFEEGGPKETLGVVKDDVPEPSTPPLVQPSNMSTKEWEHFLWKKEIDPRYTLDRYYKEKKEYDEYIRRKNEEYKKLWEPEEDTEDTEDTGEMTLTDRITANPFKNINVKGASTKQEQEAKDKWAPYKLGIEAGTTAAELLSGTYFLTRGALKGTNAVARRLSRRTGSSAATSIENTTRRLLSKMDKGQTAMSSIGFGADISQLIQGDTSWVNNAELAGDAAGIIGGTNIVRSTPWFGRYRNAIDTTLDAMGYTAAGYDVLNYLFGEE